MRYSRAQVPNPTDLESTRASINGRLISAAASGIPAGTNTNTGGAIGDASALGISVSAAESVAAERIQGTGKAEAGAAGRFNWNAKWLPRCAVSQYRGELPLALAMIELWLVHVSSAN